MIASGSPIGAALAAPVSTTTLVANKADTARIRSEVDIVVPSRVGCADRPRSKISETGGCCQVKLPIVLGGT
jgi:hypothetical protein